MSRWPFWFSGWWRGGNLYHVYPCHCQRYFNYTNAFLHFSLSPISLESQWWIQLGCPTSGINPGCLLLWILSHPNPWWGTIGAFRWQMDLWRLSWDSFSHHFALPNCSWDKCCALHCPQGLAGPIWRSFSPSFLHTCIKLVSRTRESLSPNILFLR